ncbi:MAG: glycosyltransferase family 2 protein [Anaerolineae bacterium]|jgi:undecaprenyl-phosphate 4-deoxy-4-formamido-L-arabinose transferase|nr:glycosyltransferase family 2 protein [Anaerolineae bacterium]
MMTPSLSIVIPVYNSEASVGQVVDALAQVLPGVAGAYEIILVEDGSPDQSWQSLLAARQRYPFVRVIRLMRNYGQHNALLCGIRAARYALIVTMDDDMQHPPESLPLLLAALTADVDVVYGSPERQRHGLLRDVASEVTKLVLQGAMGAETARNISAFRLFRTPVRQAFVEFYGPYVNLDVLLTWGTRRFARITIPHRTRLVGQSNYTLTKLITHTFNMVTGFSTLPLQLASLLGFTLTLFGLLLLFYIIVVRILIFGYDVPGFTFLASIIAVFAGAQMFTLGIIGEYLARMHFRIMDKPSYVIREQIDPAGTESDQPR